MPSTAYSAELEPDPRLRRLVLVAGGVLTALGLSLLLTMNLPAWLRVGASIAWLFASLAEIARLRRSYRDYGRLRFDASGHCCVKDRRGEWQPAELRPGSVLLQKLGWLRLRIAGAVTLVELCRGDARTDRDWRRLQVLWRHVGGIS